MKATFFVTLALSTFALASPLVATVQVEKRQGTAPVALCSGLSSQLQCCATDVLGVADLDCANRACLPLSRNQENANPSIQPHLCQRACNHLLQSAPALDREQDAAQSQL
jgi:hypothetical protein